VKKIKYIILTLSVVFGLSLIVLPATAGALDLLNPVCSGDAANTVLCKDRNANKNSFSNVVGVIVNSLLFIVAAVSVVVIIIAGIMYTTSGGDSALVAKAKNTLLYAVVGLVVAIMAYAIVNFVITHFQ
jgi:ABC-type bacteriocin/lantibiotic exporter with double-glycine peptidase domain